MDEHITERSRDFSSYAESIGLSAFSSPEILYDSRSSETYRSLIVLTREGKQFLSRHHHLLRDLDRWLKADSLPPEVTVEGIQSGGQSRVSFFTLQSGEKVAVKRHLREESEEEASRDVSQPYTFEIVQMETLRNELLDHLRALGFDLPTIFFATKDIYCLEYVEGKTPDDTPENREKIDRLSEIVGDFLISKKSSDDPVERTIWQNIMYDLRSDNTHPRKYKMDNFILQKDGTLVWIDPFFYKYEQRYGGGPPFFARGVVRQE